MTLLGLSDMKTAVPAQYQAGVIVMYTVSQAWREAELI